MMKKLFAFCVAFLVALSVQAATLSDDIKPTDLRVYGDAQNPTVLYVFSSLTCPHCAVFHHEVLPQILSEYVDSGKMKLVYVDMPYDPKSMTGAVLSRCVRPENYERFMRVMFENQETWIPSKETRVLITGYAKLLGMSEQEINACLANVDLRRAITIQRNNLASLYNIQAMPSVVVVKNGKSELITGTDQEEIFKTIDKILGLK